MKKMNSKFPGKCGCGCKARFEAGAAIEWSKARGAFLPGHADRNWAARDEREEYNARNNSVPRWNTAARSNYEETRAMDDAEFASLATAIDWNGTCDGTLDYNEGSR